MNSPRFRILVTFILGLLINVRVGLHAKKTVNLSRQELATCDDLEKALGDFLTGISYHYNVIYNLMHYELAVGAAELDYLRDKSGFDLRDPRDMRRLACAASSVQSIKDLSGVLKIPEKVTRSYYQDLLLPVRDVGGLAHLQELASVYTDLLAWAERNKYPILPLDVDPRDTLATFEKIDKHMREDFVKRHVRTLPFPVNLKPKQALVLLEDVETYGDLARGMDLPEDMFRSWAGWLKQDPKAIPAAILDIRVTMNLLKALDRAGLLSLK